MTATADEPALAWQSAEAALEPWFESEERFENLPPQLLALFRRAMPPAAEVVVFLSSEMLVQLWNNGTPNQRRQLARQRDYDTHPGLTEAHQMMWEKMAAVERWRLVASNKSEADREARDVIEQDQKIAGALKELSDAEVVLQREAKRLGLSSDASAKVNPPPWGKLLHWWTTVYLPLYSDPDLRPNTKTQREHARAHFHDYAPPSEDTMQELRKNEATPPEWREVGRRAKSKRTIE